MSLILISLNLEYLFPNFAEEAGDLIEFIPILGIVALAIAAILFSVHFKRAEEKEGTRKSRSEP